jgi:hypothetical protein
MSPLIGTTQPPACGASGNVICSGNDSYNDILGGDASFRTSAMRERDLSTGDVITHFVEVSKSERYAGGFTRSRRIGCPTPNLSIT